MEENTIEIHICPLSDARACRTDCAWHMTDGEGNGNCAITVLALSTNMQSQIMVGQIQAQQRAMSQQFMRQADTGSGRPPIVL